MVRLSLILHLFIGSSLAGVAVIATLVAGHVSGSWIIGAAAVGFVLALPVSWLVARRLYDR